MVIPDNEAIHMQVTVKGEFAALGMSVTPTICVLHYRRTNFPAPMNHANFLAAFQTLVEASWLAAASASWTLTEYIGRIIDDATDAGAILVVGTAGGVAGECTPAFNNQVITKQTAKRGRSYRGRVFIPSVPEGGADGNTLTAGQLALLTTLAGKLDDQITDSDGNKWNPCVVSMTNSQIVTNPTDVSAEDITTCTAEDPIGVLRSRKAHA